MSPLNLLDPSDRNGPRREVEFGAFAERADGSEAVLTVSNISYDGCEIRSEESFQISERLKLRLPRRGQILAEIRWTAQGKAGAAFVLE
jgi:hypothetical protein